MPMPDNALHLPPFFNSIERNKHLNVHTKIDFLAKIEVKYVNYTAFWRAPDHGIDWRVVTFSDEYFARDFAFGYGPKSFLTKYEGVATFYLPLRIGNSALNSLPLIFLLSDKNIVSNIYDISASSINRQLAAEIYVNNSKLVAYRNLQNFKILSAQVKSKETKVKIKDCINIPEDPNFELFKELYNRSARELKNYYYAESGIIVDRYRGARYNPAEDSTNSYENFVAVSGMLRMFGNVCHFERRENNILNRVELRPIYRTRQLHFY